MIIEKYVKSHAQILIEQMHNEWSDEVAGELLETLSDWMELKTTPKPPPNVTPNHESKTKRKRNYSNQWGWKNKVYENLFNLFISKHLTVVDVRPSDVGADSLDQLFDVARTCNSSVYKRKNHPNCRIRHRKNDDHVTFYLSREEQDA